MSIRNNFSKFSIAERLLLFLVFVNATWGLYFFRGRWSSLLNELEGFDIFDNFSLFGLSSSLYGALWDVMSLLAIVGIALSLLQGRLHQLIVAFLILFLCNFVTIRMIFLYLTVSRPGFSDNPVLGWIFFGISALIVLLTLVVFTRKKYPLPSVDSAVPLVSSRIRFLNYLIDTFIIWLFFGAIVFSLFVAQLNPPISAFVLFLIVFFLYYFLSELVFRQTIGKAFTRTLVIANRPAVGSIFVRTLLRFVPLEPFSFFVQPYNNGWHDRWSKTNVAKLSKEQEELNS